jgi:hypothetical protein
MGSGPYDALPLLLYPMLPLLSPRRFR